MTQPAADGRIFRYVVRIDRGGTPNPYHGWCSMAVCKPQIRKAAVVGDWIVGLRSRHNDQVVSAMRVDEVLPFAAYWKDPRFRAKRPGRSPTPDNLYRPVRGGELGQVPNGLHAPEAAARDLSGRQVLVSWHYWYFGDLSPELPTELIHLVHSNQEHSLHARRKPDDVRMLAAWLRHWSPGMLGRPIDLPRQPTLRAAPPPPGRS